MKENLIDLSFQELYTLHKYYKKLRSKVPFRSFNGVKSYQEHDKLQFDYFDRRVLAIEEAIDDKLRFYVGKD